MAARKLASIQRIWAIEPIEGADRVELARVCGWQCVVPKGEFSEGDLCVYFEIDSFLPVREEFEFLRSSSYKNSDLIGEGFRIRTQKMRGVLSQGLCMPTSAFPELAGFISLGYDATAALGVRKWEVEVRATGAGTIIGTLPPEVPHTDEVRIQNAPELIEELTQHPYYITTKMDGSSHSVCIDRDGLFHVCGHNYEYSDGSFYDLVTAMDLEARMREYMVDHGIDTLTVQGELCAPGIQKNPLRLDRPHWYVFTVMEDGQRLGMNGMLAACAALGVEHVPVEEVGDVGDFGARYLDVDAVLTRADGHYETGGRKEGIVIRPTLAVMSKSTGEYLSVKAVSNAYLLKRKE